MNRKTRRLTAILMALSLIAPGLLGAQGPGGVTASLNAGFDLLEQGKFDQAQKVYQEVLQKDPGHPLALNNLAVIKSKQGRYDEALGYLKQALPRGKGVKVALNRVCNIDGVCAASSMDRGEFGDEDLEAVIKSNILMVGMARSSRSPGK
jgi:hypothetical protein